LDGLADSDIVNDLIPKNWIAGKRGLKAAG